ncbi:MAG: Smr/MutS family protein [Hyphomonadaceae bacterium]
MSKKKRELTSEERVLWRRVAATAKPRRKAEPSEAHETEAPSRPGAPAKAPPAAVTLPGASSKAAASPPANRGGEKRVRRGKVEIDAVLDLHGYTQDSAFRALATFLSAARARGARCVLVITGSGRGGEGVLKRRLPDWLAGAELRPGLAGFAQAHRQHGGAGAFYVFLKKA